MDRDHDIVLGKAIGFGYRSIEDLGNCLHFEIVIAGAQRAHLSRWRSLARSETFSRMAPAILPLSSMRSRSRASPQPRSTAQYAPPESMASISIASRVIAPVLPTPAGI